MSGLRQDAEPRQDGPRRPDGGRDLVSALPVFVINLERDSERRRHMAGLLERLGLAAEFVPAVDGRRLTPSERAAAYDRARALRIYGVEMMDTEIACCLSHHHVYRRMIRDGIETALILEDDVRVDAAFPQVLQDVLGSGFQDWLVVRLDTKRSQVQEPPSAKFRGASVAALSGGRALYRLRTHVLGTGAYLIRREGAARMLRYGGRVFMPIDQTMDRFWENGILPYVVRPFPVLQGEDFGSSTGVRPPDRRGAQPVGVRVLRRVQRAVDSVRKRMFNLVR